MACCSGRELKVTLRRDAKADSQKQDYEHEGRGAGATAMSREQEQLKPLELISPVDVCYGHTGGSCGGQESGLPPDASCAMPGIPTGCSGPLCGSGPSVCPDSLPGLTAGPPAAPTACKTPGGLPDGATEGDADGTPNKNVQRQTDLFKAQN